MNQKNLAEKKCRECGEQYDTPHKENCTRRRTPSTSDGQPRVLVKMEDVEGGGNE